MEEEKKKKKNRRRKNKPGKTTDTMEIGSTESTHVEQNHTSQKEKNDDNHVSETPVVQNGTGNERGRDLEKYGTNRSKSVSPSPAEVESRNGLDREASLQETINQLQKENDTHKVKEASLEIKIKQIQEGKNAYMQKQASLQETVSQLQKENDAHILKVVCLEEKIKELQNEKDAHLQKESHLERKVSELLEEVATLNSKRVSLEGKITLMEDSWLQNDNATKETIAKLNGDNIKLQAQVIELEESRKSLLQENQQMIENLSSLQSQIQSHDKNAVSRHASTENTMVNELYVELDQSGAPTEPSSSIGHDLIFETVSGFRPDLTIETAERPAGTSVVADNSALRPEYMMVGTAERPEETHFAEPMFQMGERSSAPSQSMESMDSIVIKDGKNGDDIYAAMIPNYPKTMDSEEIVQIPLDEGETEAEAKEDVALQAAACPDEKDGVPLIEAPLIGAPFRLISFVARYVSGADLVNKASN